MAGKDISATPGLDMFNACILKASVQVRTAEGAPARMVCEIARRSQAMPHGAPQEEEKHEQEDREAENEDGDDG